MNPYYQPLPPEMDSPQTAWPYLKRRFPWLFSDEGEIPKESRAAELTNTEKDVLQFAVYMLREVHFSLADISEALTGQREYGGAMFTRVKAVRTFLTTTTLDIEAKIREFDEIIA